VGKIVARLAPAAVDLICGFEGYHARLPDGRAAPYRCPAYVPTIGYGSIWRADGSRVAMTDLPITRDEAMALMARELATSSIPAVKSLIITSRLHPLCIGALVSFTYNLGAGALRSSGLRRAVNDGRYGDVPREFAKWRMAGGRVLAGLVRRRAAESDMFAAGIAARSDRPTPAGEILIGRWETIVARAA
jgi:lysozyme